MAIEPTALRPNPAPTSPELPTRKNDEDANEFVARLSQAYRHGNVWHTAYEDFARILLHQVSGIEVLRPEVREEAVDILGRLHDAKKLVSPIPANHVPEPILPAALRAQIFVALPHGALTAKQALVPSAN